MNSKIMVAMSGGVDSSGAAYILKKKGYDVVGVTMCLGVNGSGAGENSKCCGPEAIDDARKVARKLDIPHYILDFAEDMERDIIDNFVSEYVNGRTPNPCVRCNEFLKFGKLLGYARKMGFDYMATGHYARIVTDGDKCFLARPKDTRKDQTYFLYPINKEYLKMILFPLADYTKEEVREMAREAGLSVADKSDSQDICFVSGSTYKDFVLNRSENKIKKGNIVNKEGAILGTHSGIINYTKGQRSGLGIAAGEPLYVTGLDSERNEVIVGFKGDIRSSTLTCENVNILVDDFPRDITAKIRYAHKEARCSVSFEGDKTAKVFFDSPQESLTPGQSVVFYSDDIVLGGGIIKESI